MRMLALRTGRKAMDRRSTLRKLTLESLERRTVFSANPVAELMSDVTTCEPLAAIPAAEGEPVAAHQAMGPAYPALVDQLMSLQLDATKFVAEPLSPTLTGINGPEGEPEDPGDPPVGEVPVIVNYRAVPMGERTWAVAGTVEYSNLSIIHVQLGGLMNTSFGVDPDGYFQFIKHFDAPTSGEVWAQAYTPSNVFSNVESVYLFIT